MLIKYILLYFLLTLSARVSDGKLDFSFLTNLISSVREERSNCVEETVPIPGAVCDENRLMYHLARLFVTSPERIIIFITKDDMKTVCNNINATINKINNDFKKCRPLSKSNLYMKLFKSVKGFKENFCMNDSRAKRLNAYRSCFRELHEDFLDCEGPADWFEKDNQSIVCKTYADILNCNYMKTAELCGLDCARKLRSASVNVFEPVVPYRCNLPKKMPKIKDPMPPLPEKGLYSKYVKWFFIIFISCASLLLIAMLIYYFVQRNKC